MTGFPKWFSDGKWLMAGFGLASLIIGAVNFSSYQNAVRLIESTDRSRQTYDVIKNLVDVFAEMTVAESARRGYVFGQDENDLSRYQVAMGAIELEMAALRQRLADNPAQTQRFTKLEMLLNQRLSLMHGSMKFHQKNPAAKIFQKEITAESIVLRGEIQAVIADMQREEERSLHQWLKKTQSHIRSRLWLEFFVTCFSFGLLAVIFWLLHRQSLRRQEAASIQNRLARERELSEMKLQFFSMVSHEFRTPLSVILGASQLLEEGDRSLDQARRHKNLYRIQSSARLMTQLLTDVLTMGRADAGKLNCHPEPLDVEAFCLNLVEDLQLSNPQSVINFASDGCCGLANLDEKLLYSILSNLLMNGLKYSTVGSPLQLALRCEAGATVFEVSDRGMGISPEDQQRLYEPFFRLQNVAAIPGTGLGLTVVKRCIDLHHGEIAIASTIGMGTTFTIKIPQHLPQMVQNHT